MDIQFPVHAVSFPRSGHHLTLALLKSYFGPEFRYSSAHHYDEYPQHEDPHFLKDHDMYLGTFIAPGKRYLVQIRDFLDAANSWNAHAGRETSPNNIRQWARENTHYYCGFLQKWVLSDELPGSLRLTVLYHDLISDPRLTFSRIVEFFGAAVDMERIERAVEENPVNPRRQTPFYL